MQTGWPRKLLRYFLIAIAAFVGLSVFFVLVFRFVPVFGSMVMVERKVGSWLHGDNLEIQQQWTPWARLSDNAKLAVMAGEDQRFPDHWGFDTDQIRRALTSWSDGGDLRGASTISQQTARNLFLWTGRSWVRKGLEAWFTLLLEALWPKQRILEVYLNIAEWDTGVFGLQAAAEHYFGTSAANLSVTQASRLAAILPNPRGWSASRPSPYVLQRAAWIQRQMRNLGGTAFLQRIE
ncbi:monofunctional biosynthetic peptidoglycan transglycosylase [Salinicola sp. DM10]|uniref:monofunctional biosynthetic peptidoglycan transglycosylase n=1 Tax=Salinicola sp. DM10 TaxID=2815721 RepID=UPI001A8E6E59|nr:monofunctional biosynthetic peptidoglycan transglycosylase [Salinicola sp. DM10]MCE3027242.1 monofunctional biosynthetic peptidoglycan transglycosylase [Salinicola sp. DM10]